MKSQPDIKIRRLAVFGGLGDLEAGTAWSRRASDDRRAGAADTGGVVHPLVRDRRRAVSPLSPPRAGDLRHAA